MLAKQKDVDKRHIIKQKRENKMCDMKEGGKGSMTKRRCQEKEN